MAYIIMLFSSAFNITSGSLIRQYEKKHTSGRLMYLAILCLFSSLFFFVTDKNGLSFNPKLIFYGLLSGFFYCTAYFLTFVAYANGSFALTNLIVSFSLASSVIYGLFFLHDNLSVYGYIGLILIFVSIFTINFPQKKDGKKEFSVKWLLAVLGCFVGNSAIGVIRKIQQLEFANALDNEYSILMTGSGFAVFLLISFITEKDEWKHFFSPSRLYAVGSGVCNGAQNFAVLLVNRMMIISIAGPLFAGMNIILNFAVSLLIFKEKFSKIQLFGTALGIASVVLLSI